MSEEYPSNEEIENLQKEGHTFHCAMRILCGDGECECGKTSTVTPGFSGKLYGNLCAVCMREDGHEPWCRVAQNKS